MPASKCALRATPPGENADPVPLFHQVFDHMKSFFYYIEEDLLHPLGRVAWPLFLLPYQ